MKSLRQLYPSEVSSLQKSGCSAEHWERIRVADGFEPQRLQDTHFFGDVTLGGNSGVIRLDGIERPCGIRHALVSHCQIGDDVLIANIGTVRDSAKWPARDRRGAADKRDLICFQVFSPYTVEKMRIGRDLLQKYYDKTPKEDKAVMIGGATIRRLLLRKGAKYYGLAIDRYLLEHAFSRLEQFAAGTFAAENLSRALAAPNNAAVPPAWVDLAGLLAEKTKIDQLVDAVGRGSIASLDELTATLRGIQEQYENDEWAYICQACAQEYGEPPAQWTVEKMRALLVRYADAAGGLAALTLADAKIEFDDFARIGYGLFAEEEQRQRDFHAVRGRMETHATIQQCEAEIQTIRTRVEKLAQILTTLSM